MKAVRVAVAAAAVAAVVVVFAVLRVRRLEEAIHLHFVHDTQTALVDAAV